jgi:hypothetical protein
VSAAGLDFVIVGAPRAGTTTLFEYFRTHPQLVLPQGKEAPFFANENFSSMGWEAYARSVFPRDTEGRLVGKADPLYMAGGPASYRGPLSPEEDDRDPSESEDGASYIPGRIFGAFPEAKIIAILRDPVDRAVASHALARLQQWDTAPTEERLAALLAPRALAWARGRPSFANFHVVAGEYGRILSGYLNFVSPSQLLVTTTSDLADSPATVLRRCFTFLGVDPNYVPPSLGSTFNSVNGRRKIDRLDPYRIRGRIQTLPGVSAVVPRLSARQRAWLASVTREAAYKAFLWNRADAQSAPAEISSELESRLHDHYADDLELLAGIVGQDIAMSLQRRHAQAA